MFELSNEEREYFGLEAVQAHWKRVEFYGDKFRPASVLYLEGDVIKKHVVSTENFYCEKGYDEPTFLIAEGLQSDFGAQISVRGKTGALKISEISGLKRDFTGGTDEVGVRVLPPKTTRGKSAKLTPSALESRTPAGIYVEVANGVLTVANNDTQRTFYSSTWQTPWGSDGRAPSEILREFIKSSDENHFKKLAVFKAAKRKNVKFKAGDYFAFKLDRERYGFGRVLLDIDKVRRSGVISRPHGLLNFMARPVLVQLFIYAANEPVASVDALKRVPRLPADVMMDNALFYGDYEIFAHEPLSDDELEFFISFHASEANTYVSWGLIHIETEWARFRALASSELKSALRAQGHVIWRFGVGIMPHYSNIYVKFALENGGKLPAERYLENDLRAPDLKPMKDEIFRIFGLDPNASYVQNCRNLGVKLPSELGLIG